MNTVLVLMSTYNGETNLKEQLDSIQQQSGVVVELLIRDDGSVDHTREIIEDYKRQYPDFYIELICGENVGFAKSFTELTDFACKRSEEGQGYDYYAFSDQDDVWLPNKLLMAVDKLKNLSLKAPNVYCSNTNLVDEKLSFLRIMNAPGSVKMTVESFLLRNIAVGCTMVFNHKALWLYANFTPKYIIAHDYIMFLIGVFLGNYIYDESAYINYRQHSNNQIGIALSMGARMKKRVKRIKRKHTEIQEKSINSFLDSYKSFLTLDTIYILASVAFYKRNLWNRMSLLFSRKFTLNTLEKSFFVKLKIALGSL